MKTNLRTMLFLAGVTLIVSNACVLAHTDVTAEQARDLIYSTPDLIVVDVREPYEYCDATGHIPGALNYPWNSGVLEARYEELPMHSPILVVCRSGGRSNRASNFLDSKGFAMVYDMRGGMRAWIWETAPCKYAGGSGTAADPYRIATAGDLMLLGESPEDYDKHFILTSDIDLAPNLPGRKVFDRAVIAQDANDASPRFEGTPFTGVFDGNGHTISHLTIRGVNTLGLFGKLDSGAKISNLGLEAVDVSGTGRYVGSLVGNNRYGIITTSCSTGTISGHEDVGGLVGYNSYGSIITSYSTCQVRGERIVGGLLGSHGGGDATVGGILINCYSTGMVDGEGGVGGLVGINGGIITTSYSSSAVSGTFHVGGLVGDYPFGLITTSYSTGTVTGDRSVGGLVGHTHAGIITTSYSTGTVTGIEDVGGLVGYTMGGRITTSFWDIETSGMTVMCGSPGVFPSGCDDSYGRTTAEMQDINTYLSVGWDFVDEILNGTCDYWQISPSDYPRLRYPVMPEGLGTGEKPYLIRDTRDLGTVWFEPQAHYRLEASVDLTGITWSMAVVPWFGGTFDGKGHVISNLHIQGSEYLGLFGQLGSGAKISDLGLEAVDVNGIAGIADVGGLVGNNDGGSISTCYSNGTVNGADRVGGLAGSNYDGSITASYSNGTVTGNKYVGGLVGRNGGSITTSYSTGTVIASGWLIGGLVGYNRKDSIINSSFWDMETSGQTTSAGGTGLTTAEMQTASTFLDAGWDFVGETANGTEDIWWILEGQDYPRLWWEKVE